MKLKQKIGIALEGGGAKGAYQIGVLKAIQELNISYDCVAGTSIGAVNAAGYVLGDYEGYFSHWTDMKFSFKGENETNQNKKFYKLNEILVNMKEFKEEYLNSKGINPEKIINMLKENINEEAVRKSNVALGLTTYSITDNKPLNLFIDDIPEGMLCEYIFASCNLPIFSPRLINGKYFLDGGVYNPLPVNMLAEIGCETIIAVRLRKDPYDFSLYKTINIIDVAPDEFLSETLHASSERIKWMIDKGYEDALKKLD